MGKTLLAIGAHYDDCIFGVPGVLLEAVRHDYRVVILSIIGDYTNWAPVGRERQNVLINGTRDLCEKRGVEIRFLPYKSMGFTVDEETRKAVSEVVAELQPELGFLLWPMDRHPDHEIASQLSKIAFQWAAAVLKKNDVRRPQRLYYYDNGPRHTIGFEPDTFFDISTVWAEAVEWLGGLMGLVLGERSPSVMGPIRAKESLASYRGKTCGVEYCEAFQAFQAYPVNIL